MINEPCHAPPSLCQCAAGPMETAVNDTVPGIYDEEDDSFENANSVEEVDNEEGWNVDVHQEDFYVHYLLHKIISACVGRKIYLWIQWALTIRVLYRCIVVAVMLLPLLFSAFMHLLYPGWSWGETLVWITVACGPNLLSLLIIWRFNLYWWRGVYVAMRRVPHEKRMLLKNNCYGRFRWMVMFFTACQVVSYVLYLDSSMGIGIVIALVFSFVFAVLRSLLIAYTITIHELVSRVCKEVVRLLKERGTDLEEVQNLYHDVAWSRNITGMGIWVGCFVEGVFLALWHNSVMHYPRFPVPLVTFTLHARQYYTKDFQLSIGFIFLRLLVVVFIVVRTSTLTTYGARQKAWLHDNNQLRTATRRWLAGYDYFFSLPIPPRVAFVFPLSMTLVWVCGLAGIFMIH